jgi:uncharacterized protein (TIGR04562 family)
MSTPDHVLGRPVNDPIYHFPWSQLEAIIAGRSAIDLQGLRIGTRDAARGFECAYGFDPDDLMDRAELAEVRRRAQRFIEEVLLPYGGQTELPELPESYEDLLLVASTPDHPLRDWVCSFLKVSHAVVHARYSHDPDVLSAARQQIFDRFSSHLKVGPGGMVVTDGEMHIPLIRCDFKAEKPWESLVLKLLHKVDAVAQEVYDHLGVRFVTPDKAYALLLLKYFRYHDVFAFPNIKPSRSINTLLDLADFRAGFEELEEAYHHGELTFKEFTGAVHRLGRPPQEQAAGRNPHSASDYQTMQFTARALVRQVHGDKVVRTFVPFEVQIMDEPAYRQTQAGAADHGAYRVRQRQAVCKRVFPWLPTP